SAYPTFSTPASTWLSDANDVCGDSCAAGGGADVQLATEVAATANPMVRAKSRRVITGDMLDLRVWTCKSKVQALRWLRAVRGRRSRRRSAWLPRSRRS